jgi:hypothetical protein
MKRYESAASLIATFVFLFGASASAADESAASAETPAILASLDARHVTVLDAGAAAAIRGQGSEYRYVLVKVLGLNALDFGPGLEWTWNPFGYRYGAWGGPGWTNGGRTDVLVDPADAMDALFKNHDLLVLDDQGLVDALKDLPNVGGGFWGLIYVPSAGAITPGSGLPVDKNVFVSGVSFIGGRFFLGWRPMPFTEYARREALAGMQLLIFLR